MDKAEFERRAAEMKARNLERRQFRDIPPPVFASPLHSIPESDTAKWLAWAERYADSIDPMRGSLQVTPQELRESHLMLSGVQG